MSLLGGRGEGSSSGGSGGYSRSNTSSFDQRPTAEPDYADQGITDDDIPF
jgi:single-strand DNA-binding protein